MNKYAVRLFLQDPVCHRSFGPFACYEAARTFAERHHGDHPEAGTGFEIDMLEPPDALDA